MSPAGADRSRSQTSAFGGMLRRFRELAGLSQEELARRSEVSVQAIGALERGERRRPYPHTLDVLARALNLGPGERSLLVAAAQEAPTRPEPRVPSSLIETIGNNPRDNLPRSLNSFVGRDRALVELERLLSEARLITLTGAGGVGKTRLAIELARRRLEAFADGGWVVDLASLTDPTLVGYVVAGVLGLREESYQPILSTLVRHLQTKQILVVLDNCEHLVDASAQLVSALLQNCPDLRLIATSQEPLRVAGEVVWRVAALRAPGPVSASPVAELTNYDAVRLFVDRASAASGFTLSQENWQAVGELCHQLDGMPLAIELAAARVGALTVDQIAANLDRRFQLLTSGSRSGPERQRTLRAMLDWSYDALDEPEQITFRRLGPFAGGFTLDAAASVTADRSWASEDRMRDRYPPTPASHQSSPRSSFVVDVLGRLVSKSLLGLDEIGGKARYRLLETTRQYALERLEEAGEAVATRDRHGAWYSQLAARTQPAFWGRASDETARRQALAQEQDNQRAALGWYLQSNPDAGLRLAADLAFFWIWCGQVAEGRRWIESMLARSPGRTFARAYALLGLGTLVWDSGDIDGGRRLESESIALFRELGDNTGLARALVLAGHHGGDHAKLKSGEANVQLQTLQEALSLARETGDSFVAAWALALMGTWARHRGDAGRGKVLIEESWNFATANGSPWLLGWGNYDFGSIARSEGDLSQAEIYFAASLPFLRQAGHTLGIGRALTQLGAVVGRLGDDSRARAYLRESLSTFTQIGSQYGLAAGLATGALLAMQRQDGARSALLIGAALAQNAELLPSLDPEEQADCLDCMATARATLGDAEFSRILADGRALTLDAAIAAALGDETPT